MKLAAPAISVQGLSKVYPIYARPHDRLKQALIPRLQGWAGRARGRFFHEFRALHAVSFEIARNETVGIVGRNGSGKSTLLQILCGTLAASAGCVRVHGRVAALLELGSGFNPEFTGRENVYLNAAILGLSTRETDARMAAITEFADIGEFIDQPVKTYSSGMAVRLAFSVAINVEPDILVVDEALAVGDELFQRKCFARIEALKSAGTTILFVSHSGSTIVELCDRAMLLDAGELLTIGAPREVVGQYQRLIYAPPERQAEIRAEIRSGATVRAPEPLQSQDVSAAIRAGETRAFFEPGLRPSSTLFYASRGARIERPRIVDADGQPVNCLIRGESYRYLYEVRFDQPAQRVRFAMLIRSLTGLAISGSFSSRALEDAIPEVEPGHCRQVEFRFVCRLNPGTYFLNAGVLGLCGDEELFLHRIVDALAFRVLPVAGDRATELVDLCEFVGAATAPPSP